MRPKPSQSTTARPVATPHEVAAILVSMPFFTARKPTIQIGLLAAIGQQHGFAVSTLHLNLEFAVRLGLELYDELSDTRFPELGNWLFALDAFRDEAPDREGRLPCDHPNGAPFLERLKLDRSDLCRLRHELVPAYLQHAEGVTDWSRYKVVGFTSTFQQNTASLALARRLKEKFPHLITLFGGANLEGEMGRELMRACPWIDFAVDGEGDVAFPAFLTAIAEGRSPAGIPGVISRTNTPAAAAGPFTRLDSLPVPDYDEYFQRAEALAIVDKSDRHAVCLPIESSRGCWWGHKHHCTFCGLNGATIGFRQKSPRRVLDELGELTKRYGTFRFSAVGNIMPADFSDELVPALAAEERQYDLFFEVKSNLPRARLKAFRDAGIHTLQPGLESLSSRVLRLMHKGVSAGQNVNMLRWAAYYGIDVGWNLLWGFPGETEDDYRQQIELIPHLVHLQPPVGGGRVWLERFSPLFVDRERFAAKRIEPEMSLAYIYPAHVDRMKIAYFFDHEFEGELPDAVFALIQSAVGAWHDAWEREPRPSLTYRWSPGRLHIEDRRDLAAPRLYSFDSPLAEIYKLLSERPLSAAVVQEKLDLPWSADEVAEALDLFAAKGLVMRDEQLFLALAIPSLAT